MGGEPQVEEEGMEEETPPIPSPSELSEVVEHKTQRRWTKPRSGTVTGARVVLLFMRGGMKQKTASAAQVAAHLDMEPGYVRRVLNALAKAQILSRRTARQPGTPDVNVYRLTRRKVPLGEK